MPIVGEGENVYVEYHIPKDIKDRIPSYFYQALAGELFSVFGWRLGIQMFTDKEYGNGYYNLDSGSGGWYVAFEETCRKLDMQWLFDYWKSLEWYDSDIFDGEIEEGIRNYYINGSSDYYKYLCKKE